MIIDTGEHVFVVRLEMNKTALVSAQHCIWFTGTCSCAVEASFNRHVATSGTKGMGEYGASLLAKTLECTD